MSKLKRLVEDEVVDEEVEERIDAAEAAAVYTINSVLNLKRKAEVKDLPSTSSTLFLKVNQAVEDFVGMKVMLHDIQGEEKEVGTNFKILNARRS